MRIRLRGRTARLVYDDRLADFIKRSSGSGSTRRVSHVEPAGEDGSQWAATLEDGTVLGPFALRSDALTAERAWLREHYGL